MSTSDIIRLARKHVGSGLMDSSARLALADAVNLSNDGDYASAKVRALKSLEYSVGILHPDYQRASK
jgi:hypothetical protein